jgi:hypothetical protein
MQEGQVTIEGTPHLLEPPFLVLATQNPIEQEGTYALPEAQLDRITRATRSWSGIAAGASPRGGISLVRAARGHGVDQRPRLRHPRRRQGGGSARPAPSRHPRAGGGDRRPFQRHPAQGSAGKSAGAEGLRTVNVVNIVNDVNVVNDVRRERHKCSLDVVTARIAKATVKDVVGRPSLHSLHGLCCFCDIHDIHVIHDIHGSTTC